MLKASGCIHSILYLKTVLFMLIWFLEDLCGILYMYVWICYLGHLRGQKTTLHAPICRLFKLLNYFIKIKNDRHKRTTRTALIKFQTKIKTAYYTYLTVTGTYKLQT